jgi:hypothetical protein
MRRVAVIDCLCVLVFVVIGRASRTKGETIGGIASTAWPFLAGLHGDRVHRSSARVPGAVPARLAGGRRAAGVAAAHPVSS